MLLPDGTLAPVRCGASNRCAYCAWLAAVENSLVVGLDAKWGDPPTVGMTLTTHRPDFDLDRFRRGVENVFRWLRRDLGLEVCEYCGLMEWTTGAGGRGRMPHMHALLKGVTEDDLGGRVPDPRSPGRERYALELRLREKWEGWTGGAWVVDMRPLRSAGGAIAYVVGHHHKRDQAPPAGLRNVKRMRPSRGYFDGRLAEITSIQTGESVTPIQALRARAKSIMREEATRRATLAKLIDAGTPSDVMDDLVDELVRAAADEPPPVPVKRLPDGRLQHLSTGQVFDGPAAAIYQEAQRAA